MARAQFNTRSPFDAFLFAPIGEDSKGLIVSVLSALARLDFDPWQEAAVFARLPKEAAQARLTRMIADLPNTSPLQMEPGTIATQVLALLPDRPEPTVVPDATATVRNSTTVLRPAGLLVALGPIVLLIASAVVFALWSASIITMASQRVPTAKASQVDIRGGNRPDAARVPLSAATGIAATAGAGRATDGRGTSTTETGDGGDAHARTDMPAASGPATRSIISPH